MSKEADLGAAVTHIVLCGVSAHGLSHFSDANFTHIGMHANFFVHGVLGFLHRGRIADMGAAYTVSLHASKYLALPCVMADLYRSEKEISALHLISGVVPFLLALSHESSASDIGKVVIALNITSLCYYSYKNNQDWGWYTAGAALIAYFVKPSQENYANILYPMWLALMEHCSYRVHRGFRSTF